MVLPLSSAHKLSELASKFPLDRMCTTIINYLNSGLFKQPASFYKPGQFFCSSIKRTSLVSITSS